MQRSGTPTSPGPEASADACELCVEADPVVLGAALPLSGPLADFGAAQRRGVEAALDRATDQGGLVVGGERRQVELVVVDQRGDADVAGQLTLLLAQRRRNPTAALLAACAPPLTVVRVAEARNVPLIGACGPLPLPDGPLPEHTWQLGPAQAEHAAAVAAALGPPGAGPVAVLASAGRTTTAYGAALAAAGHPVAGAWLRAPASRSGTGWGPAVLQIRTAGATRLLALTDPPDGTLLYEELARQGWRPDAAYVRDAGLSTWWAETAGPAAEGVVTDLVGAAGERPEQAVETASAQAAQVMLDALAGAGSSRRTDVDEALRRGPATLLGTDAGRAPPSLGRWRSGVLEALPG